MTASRSSGWLIPAARETRDRGGRAARLQRATGSPSWRPSCRGSSERHHVLQFDFRGHGESDAEPRDARLARATRRRGRRRLPARRAAWTDRAVRHEHGRRDRDPRRPRPAGRRGRRRCGLRRAAPPGRQPPARGRATRCPASARGRSWPARRVRARSRLPDPIARTSRASRRGRCSLIAPKDDQLISWRQGLRLFEAAGEPKELLRGRGRRPRGGSTPSIRRPIRRASWTSSSVT